jgi:hypothetical protein
MMILTIWIAPSSGAATMQTATDEQAAATTAIELSQLEASSDFNALYDRIHPDAHAVIPRAAVIGWYQNEFAPLGPGVATVTGVRFVEWTWPVNGRTYLYTAEVSFQQPFANGTVLEDVVRLVKDDSGEWRWFFGRSREFVEEQIARYVPVVPATSRDSVLDFVAADLDAFWAISFAASGQAYVSPRISALYAPGTSSCGYIDPRQSPAGYCPVERTIYVSPDWFSTLNAAVGDFAWITVMAHEWGHHVQTLQGQYSSAGNQHELQADCLAGSYARDAATRNLLDSGDVTEAVTISALGGDAAWLLQDEVGAHGTSDERVSAFMRGYLDGFIGCNFMSTNGDATRTTNLPRVAAPELVTVLPLQHEVAADLAHTGDAQRSLAEVASNYNDSAATEQLFRSWGWNGNVTRSYEGNGATSGITLVYVSVHRFDSAEHAANALDYSVADQSTSTGAWKVPVTPLGTTTRALSTGNDVTIYAQLDDVMIRLTVVDVAGNSMATAEGIMRSMLGRLG